MKKTILTLACIVLLTSCKNTKKDMETASEEAADSVEEVTVDLKDVALKAQDALFKDFDAEKVRAYFNENYIQHNPNVPTGLGPVLGFLPGLREAGTSVTTHRVLKDGDYIVLHNSYDNAQAFGGEKLIAFDVWRMEDGKVAEHWDNLIANAGVGVSGRTQVDGPTEVADLDKTEGNKAIVSSMMEDVFFGKAPEKITEYISIVQYDQHNPAVKDGLDGLNEALAALAKANNPFIYKQVHKVLGEGNFVLTMSEGEWNHKPTAFYDLFRLEDGKIVEHWDVIQEIPVDMAHENGKF